MIEPVERPRFVEGRVEGDANELPDGAARVADHHVARLLRQEHARSLATLARAGRWEGMATVHAILHPSDELPLCKRKTGRRALVGEPLGHDDHECPDCAGRVWAGVRMLLIRLRGQKPRRRLVLAG